MEDGGGGGGEPAHQGEDRGRLHLGVPEGGEEHERGPLQLIIDQWIKTPKREGLMTRAFMRHSTKVLRSRVSTTEGKGERDFIS